MTVSKPAKRRIPLLDGLRRILSIPELGVLIPLVILVAVFTLGNKNMLNTANLMTMLRAMSYTGIIVIGQTMLMVAGEIDLSVGGVGACASALVSVLMVKAGWPWQAAVAVTMLLGIPFGLFNGLVTVKVGVPAFVVTLGTMYAAAGSAMSSPTATSSGGSPRPSPSSARPPRSA